MRTMRWCHWYIVWVFDALVTHYWQVRSRRPACHQHIGDDWLDDCRKSTWRRLCMKWIALVPARSLVERCRWLVSVLTSQRWHRTSESGQTSKIKTNPLQTVEHRNTDQGRLAVWSGRPYQMPNLSPVGRERWQACCRQLVWDRCTRTA